MRQVFLAVLFRELRAYFLSPLAYVFIAVYVLVSGLATWNLARFFDTAIASLSPFFQFQPWLLAIFIPAIGMRLWSEDLRSRTADLYFTSQRPLWMIHLAKFVSGLCVLLAALFATLPYWISVNYLGAPDNSVIVSSYVSLLLIGGLFLLITLAFSALTHQQVIAFVLSSISAFALLSLGLPNVIGQISGLVPGAVSNWIQDLSVLEAYFRTLRGTWLFADLVFLCLFGAFLFVLAVTLLSARRRTGQKFATPWLTFAMLTFFVSLPIARHVIEPLTAPLRADITEDQLNTLSPAARKLVQNLQEPIALNFYYNDGVGRDYPEIRTHAERVRALLDSFVRQSNGKLKLRTVNPVPFSEDEDLALTNGIEAVTTEGIDPLYFGLSGQNLVDDVHAISFLNPEHDASLEFDIAQLISKLDRPEQPRIAILSGLEALNPNTENASANRMLTALQNGFSVEWLPENVRNIDPTFEALIVIAPEKLNDFAAYQIDQFLLRRGRVIVLTDPLPLLSAARPPPDNLKQLFARWGFLASEDILADMDIGLPVTTNGPAGQRIEPQPLYPGPGPGEFNQSDFLVSGLKQKVYFGGTGWLMPTDDHKTTFTPLIRSGKKPAFLAAKDFSKNRSSPANIRSLSAPLDSQVAIAARISGRFTTAFRNGAPEPELPEDPVLQRIAAAEIIDRPHVSASRVPGEIVVIADTDFLLDAFYVNRANGQPIADNEALMLTLLDQFAGRPELAALRTRPLARRPMTRIVDMREAAEKQYLKAQDEIEAEIAQLQQKMSGDYTTTDPKLRDDYLRSRKELRELQKSFRSSINAVEFWLRLFTIWLPVSLTILTGLLIYVWGRRFS